MHEMDGTVVTYSIYLHEDIFSNIHPPTRHKQTCQRENDSVVPLGPNALFFLFKKMLITMYMRATFCFWIGGPTVKDIGQFLMKTQHTYYYGSMSWCFNMIIKFL